MRPFNDQSPRMASSLGSARLLDPKPLSREPTGAPATRRRNVPTLHPSGTNYRGRTSGIFNGGLCWSLARRHFSAQRKTQHQSRVFRVFYSPLRESFVIARPSRGHAGWARKCYAGPDVCGVTQALHTHDTANLGSSEESRSCHGDQALQRDRTRRT